MHILCVEHVIDMQKKKNNVGEITGSCGVPALMVSEQVPAAMVSEQEPSMTYDIHIWFFN